MAAFAHSWSLEKKGGDNSGDATGLAREQLTANSVRDSATDPDVLGLGMYGFCPSSQPLNISLQFRPTNGYY